MCKETERRKKRLRNRLRHHLHPWHLYCRLCSRYSERRAKGICIWYETYIWRWLKLLIQKLPEGKKEVLTYDS